jgi:SAM-dependent methyltransferase
MSLLGKNLVVANDVRPTMIEPLVRRVAALREAGCPIQVEGLLGDVGELSLHADSFDGVFSNQVIEHACDLDRMFERLFCVLRPEGRCIVVDDNNALNRRERLEHERMWRLRDESLEYIEQLKAERPIENESIEPYLQMRIRIVREYAAHLQTQHTEELARSTAGMTREAIRRIVVDWKPGYHLPAPPRYAWCRNPETGEYCERLLDPFWVADRMTAAGFRVRLEHAFRRVPLCWLNRCGLPALQRWLFELRPMFVLVAFKPVANPPSTSTADRRTYQFSKAPKS